MQDISKIKSYVGFAIKSGKIVYGVDNIIKYSPKYVFIDEFLAPNSKKKLINFLENKDIKYIVIEISQIIQNENCKAFGLLDNNLIKAIKKVINKGELINE